MAEALAGLNAMPREDLKSSTEAAAVNGGGSIKTQQELASAINRNHSAAQIAVDWPQQTTIAKCEGHPHWQHHGEP